ncbi:hypothetical protein [Nocardioides caricicola]|uniref:Uncharacterized protein n=1 Tax=Nocardioides caricicola TaxID=634770 RepID=A0ABW0N324_9ACTN
MEILARIPFLAHDQTSVIAAVHGREVLLDTREFSGRMGVRQARLSLWRVSGSGLTKTGDVPTVPNDHPQNALNPELSAKYVVWMEDPDTELTVSPWHLMANDRSTGATDELAAAPDLEDGNPPIMPPGWTGAVLRNDRVYWAQVSGSMRKEKSDIWGCTVADCSPASAISGAAFPTASDAGLFAIQSQRFLGSKGYGDRFTVVRQLSAASTPEVVATVSLRPGEVPFGLAAGPDAVAWVIDGPVDRITVHELATGSEVSFVSTPSGGFGYPVVTKDTVLWVETTGPREIGGYLYDRSRDKVMTVGNKLGLRDIGGQGDLVYWQEASRPSARPEDISYVIAKVR